MQSHKNAVLAGLSCDLDELRNVISLFADSDQETKSRAEVVFDVLMNLRDRLGNTHSAMDPSAAGEIMSIADELIAAADACPDRDFAASIQAVSCRLAALMFSIGVVMSTEGLVFVNA